MPKGRKETFRRDCEQRPQVFRAGLEKVRVRVFTFECNPDNNDRVRRHHVNPRVHIVQSAVSRLDVNVTI